MAVTNPYMVLADVEERFQDFSFISSTKPSDTEVNRHIDLISDDMEEQFIACGIDTENIPAGKSDKLELVCGYGVLAFIYRTVDVDVTRQAMYRKLYEDDMKKICANPSILGLATAISEGVTDTFDTAPDVFDRDRLDW